MHPTSDGSSPRRTPPPSNTVLPDDVLYVICEEIAAQHDFDTLFRCAQTGKRLAVPAATHLYRRHHLSPIRGGTDNAPIQEQRIIVQRWAIMWRSIIASAIGTTVIPYCKYIQVLDLRDLTYLFEDDNFNREVSKYFFSGHMAQFNITTDKSAFSRTRGKGKTIKRLDIVRAIDAIGDVITQHAATLEEVSGNVLSSAIVKWAPRLSRLETLELWEGRALADEETQKAIHTYCPKFNSLKFMLWEGEEADMEMSRLIQGMTTQKLAWFEVFNRADIGAETCIALGDHGQHLTTLKLNLKTEGLQHLGLLRNCTSLQTLELEHIQARTQPTDLEKTQNDVFHEMIEWLSHCTNLKTLSFGGFPSAPALCTPLLLHNDARLHTLKLDSYKTTVNRDFYHALVHQSGLQSLSLTTTDIEQERPEVITNSISQLKQLRDLKLTGLSDAFSDGQIIALVDGLPELEDFYFTGAGFTDAVLLALRHLKNLKRVDMAGVTDFTYDGLKEFITGLGPGNRGIEIVVAAAEPLTMLEDWQQASVRTLVEKAGVEGRFDYQPFRDPDMSEFEGDDSD